MTTATATRRATAHSTCTACGLRRCRLEDGECVFCLRERAAASKAPVPGLLTLTREDAVRLGLSDGQRLEWKLPGGGGVVDVMIAVA